MEDRCARIHAHSQREVMYGHKEGVRGVCTNVSESESVY